MADAPQKDVVYIDVEDDITAIIGKLKEAKKHIVALVPPKRTGILQSAVNLRLLARTAEQHDKRLVIITSNSALISLAASARIPVAKNLQTKPELGEIAALDIDNGEEVIDGAELPVDEHARMATNDDGEIESALGAAAVGRSEASARVPGARSSRRRSASRVPDFNSFRKKLFLLGALGAFLIAFFVWAIMFAPHATVVLTTRTTAANVSQQVTIGPKVETDVAKSMLAAEEKATTQDISISYDATGTINAGEKATATVKFSQQALSSKTVAAGTKLKSSTGLIFVTDESVTVPASSVGSAACFPTACPGTVTVKVTADAAGAGYNGATGSLSGAGDGISASFTAASAGGTDKEVAAVTQEDLDTAKKQIDAKLDVAAAKQTLQSQLGDGYIVIEDTFTSDTSKIESDTTVDGEAPSGTAKLEGTVTYSMYAVSKEVLGAYLDAVVAQQIDNTDQQRIYDNGSNTVQFANAQKTTDGMLVSLTATGAIGPKIDDAQVKTIAAGKNYGDIQQALTAISGVDSADTKFSPFWVTKAPTNVDKISVEFTLNEQ